MHVCCYGLHVFSSRSNGGMLAVTCRHRDSLHSVGIVDEAAAT